MKSVDVIDNIYIYIYIDFNKDVNDKDHKFQVSDHARISKYKTFWLKDILQIGLKKFL